MSVKSKHTFHHSFYYQDLVLAHHPFGLCHERKVIFVIVFITEGNTALGPFSNQFMLAMVRLSEIHMI